MNNMKLLWIRRILWYGIFGWWFIPIVIILLFCIAFLLDGKDEAVEACSMFIQEIIF